MKQASRIYELRPANLPKYAIPVDTTPTTKDFFEDSLNQVKMLWQKLQRALPKLKQPQFATPTSPSAKYAEATETAESAPSAEPIKDRILKWLRYLALYLGAVMTAGAVAIFFLWQIPLLQDLPQLVKNISDPQAVRPAATPTSTPAIEPPTAPQPQVAQTAHPPLTPPVINQAGTPPSSNTPPAPQPGSAAPPVAVAGQPSSVPATTANSSPTPTGTGTITVTNTLPPANTTNSSAATGLPAPTGTITVNTTLPPTTEAAPTSPPNPDGSQPAPAATATAPPTANPTAAPTTPPTDPAAAATASASATTPLTPEAANALTPAQQQQEIRQLLIDAQEQMASRRFVSPTSSNALQSYQRVLELEPTNPVASEGVQRIATYYQQIAQQTLQQGRVDESLSYISRGLRAAPNNETLLRLRRDARSAKQRQEQQRRAALEERRRQEAEVLRRRQEEEAEQEARAAAVSRRAPPPVPPANWRQPPPTWGGQRSTQQPSYNESGFNQR